MAKENKPLLRNQKGWRGYVRDFNNYCDAYDDVEWNGTASGSTKKKEKQNDHHIQIISIVVLSPTTIVPKNR
jgi:hypothetical protein